MRGGETALEAEKSCLRTFIRLASRANWCATLARRTCGGRDSSWTIDAVAGPEGVCVASMTFLGSNWNAPGDNGIPEPHRSRTVKIQLEGT